MSDKNTGTLEVGTNGDGEVVINHPDLEPDENGVGHIVFSPNQARHLAQCLLRQATEAEMEAKAKQPSPAPPPPVNRSARVLTNGLTEEQMPEYRQTDATGQQKAYVVLSAQERSKGFIRPVRRSYRHIGALEDFENDQHPSGEVQRWKQRTGGCGAVTSMGIALAETYARDPQFYSGTYCSTCGEHFPLTQFVWEGTDEQVGS